MASQEDSYSHEVPGTFNAVIMSATILCVTILAAGDHNSSRKERTVLGSKGKK